MISFRHVSKSFDRGRHFAVDDVSLEVRDGETLVLLGSSGSGKTTLLKLTNRLLEMTSGTIEVDGQDIADLDPIILRRKIGYVFQGIGLFANMTVEENVAIVTRLLGWAREERRSRAHELLELVGLEPAEYADRFPEELSGGQQQRVGVGRALAADPAYLLMDEPFGALDSLTRLSLRKELIRIWSERRKTILFVTHDVDEALQLAQRIVVFTPRPGRIADVVEVGLDHPRDLGSPEYGRIKNRLYELLGVEHSV